eukprot:9341393-Lingulodinium_polyedra.AAC.1
MQPQHGPLLEPPDGAVLAPVGVPRLGLGAAGSAVRVQASHLPPDAAIASGIHGQGVEAILR